MSAEIRIRAERRVGELIQPTLPEPGIDKVPRERRSSERWPTPGSRKLSARAEQLVAELEPAGKVEQGGRDMKTLARAEELTKWD
jgi:hypothetical protein